MWTNFHDTCIGGSTKERWNNIIIEAEQSEAIIIFKELFGHNPIDIDCVMYEQNYVPDEGELLGDVTWFDRGCKFINDGDESHYLEEQSNRSTNKYISLEDLMHNNGKILFADNRAPRGSMVIRDIEKDINWLVIPEAIIEKLYKPKLQLCM